VATEVSEASEEQRCHAEAFPWQCQNDTFQIRYKRG